SGWRSPPASSSHEGGGREAMRIVRFSLETFAIAGPRPRPGVALRLLDDEGAHGDGEASPLLGVSREDLAASRRALGAVGARLRIVPEADCAEDAVREALAPFADELASVPSARFALESALLDLLGQRRGASVAACLRGGDPLPEVRTNGLVDGF